MEPAQLPHEILLYISTFSTDKALLQQLLLHRPFYEYYTANRQYCIQLHTVVTTHRTCDKYVSYKIFNKCHREDGPAVIWANGTQYWYRNNKLHRELGPAIIVPCGAQEWYQNGLRHREDGPAIVYADGTQCWYYNDERHREDGPAIVRPGGFQDWYCHGKKISQRKSN